MRVFVVYLGTILFYTHAVKTYNIIIVTMRAFLGFLQTKYYLYYTIYYALVGGINQEIYCFYITFVLFLYALILNCIIPLFTIHFTLLTNLCFLCNNSTQFYLMCLCYYITLFKISCYILTCLYLTKF